MIPIVVEGCSLDSFSIEDAVSKCLSRYCIDGVVVKKLDCTKLRYMSKAISCSGVYVFSGNNTVYYVGQSSNLYRRLVNEHCSASIGSSEGVVRFLMYLLDRVCSSDEVFREVDVKKREAIDKSIICLLYTSPSPRDS